MLEQLRAKLHAVLQEARVEQVALPLVGGGTLVGGEGGEKSRSRKRGRGDSGEGEEEEEEEEEQESEEVGQLFLSNLTSFFFSNLVRC